MDTDGSGTITMDELAHGLRQMDCTLAESQIAEVMQQVDFDGNGVIDHDEFIAATLHLNKLTEEANLMNAFRAFDADGDGVITLDELKASWPVRLDGNCVGRGPKRQCRALLAGGAAQGDRHGPRWHHQLRGVCTSPVHERIFLSGARGAAGVPVPRRAQWHAVKQLRGGHQPQPLAPRPEAAQIGPHARTGSAVLSEANRLCGGQRLPTAHQSTTQQKSSSVVVCARLTDGSVRTPAQYCERYLPLGSGRTYKHQPHKPRLIGLLDREHKCKRQALRTVPPGRRYAVPHECFQTPCPGPSIARGAKRIVREPGRSPRVAGLAHAAGEPGPRRGTDASRSSS
eukprot:scaffold1574_cov373-Prasinococcus_capsulatus_cf.AAC.17